MEIMLSEAFVTGSMPHPMFIFLLSDVHITCFHDC